MDLNKKQIIELLIKLQGMIDKLEGDDGTLDEQIDWEKSKLALLEAKKKFTIGGSE